MTTILEYKIVWRNDQGAGQEFACDKTFESTCIFAYYVVWTTFVYGINFVTSWKMRIKQIEGVEWLHQGLSKEKEKIFWTGKEEYIVRIVTENHQTAQE